jgi:hypothetical protein
LTRTTSIVEAVNGLELDPDWLRSAENLARNRLERFFRMIWPQFSQFRHEVHEQLAEFTAERSRVLVRVDLACWNEIGQLLIIDWKTGGWQNEMGGRIQLAVYALWAVASYHLPLTSIVPVVVGLRTGEITRFQPTENDLSFVRDLIENDRAIVNEFNKTHDFPAAPESGKCWACSFLGKCPEGREAVGL